jgi:Fe-S-cluster containining protein
MSAHDGTVVATEDVLPLTCTREGTCCHGKQVWLNPWELASLAASLGRAVAALIDEECCDGGIRLRFDGPAGPGGLPACRCYRPGRGCAGHAGRPLACRLYPLGRERRGERVQYRFDGPQFPCLGGCPSVRSLPARRVGDYLREQGVADYEAVSDAYLELVQDIAEAAFAVAIDSGLVASGHRGLHARWQALGLASHQERSALIPPPLLTALLNPRADPLSRHDEDRVPLTDGAGFVQAHAQLLQDRLQADYGSLIGAARLADASLELLAAALHLAASLQADRQVLMARWLRVASDAGMR